MIENIRRLPKATLVNKGRSDPLEGILPGGLELTVKVEIDPDEATIHVDLSDNPPCVDVGLNTSLGAATSAVVGAIFNALDKDIPRNAGSFRRLRFTYAEESVVAAPKFPHSCSMGTTNVSERLVNITQSAFAQLGDGHGLAEGGTGLGAGMAVISGKDARRGGAPFVNRMMLSTNGGPASPVADGWVNYAIPVIAGLMYRDSIEVDELKHPIRVDALSLVQDSAGAGRRRGAPAQTITLTPTGNDVTAVISCDGQHTPPRGVAGGHDGTAGETWRIGANGDETRLPNVIQVALRKGEVLRGRDSAGGGYGDPMTREPARVLHDVLEGWESRQKARDVYGVVFTGEIEDETLAVDEAATAALRREKGGHHAA
jgi:N-methylhydantoinase B